jgi:hypothetical protein
VLSGEQPISIDNTDSESISEIDLDVLIKIRTELKSILEDIRKN